MAKKPVISKRFDDLGKDGRPVRLGIMGGTFDPIHFGHLACAEQVRDQLDLDAVIFIPAGVPVYKIGTNVTPAAQRLRMVELAVKKNPAFDASSIEIDRGGNTYTVDTLRQMRAHYPENVEFYFITGADAVVSIAKWRESAAVASLARVVAVNRPGYELPDVQKEFLAACGFRVEYIEITALAISSSDLRARVAKGQSIRYLTKSRVADYVEEHGLYCLGEAGESEGALRAEASESPEPATLLRDGEEGECEAPYPDCLSQEFFDLMTIRVKDRVRPKRFNHILGVADMAGRLAESYGVDVDKARLAGILHDWDKGYDDPGIQARANQLGMDVDPFVLREMPRVLHGNTAAVALSREFPQMPGDVIQAIDRHTSAAVDMSDLDMVVYVADALEEGRQFGRVDELRQLIGEVSLEELFFEVMAYWNELLLQRKITVHPDTVNVWNEYVIRRNCRLGKTPYITGQSPVS